MKFLEKKEDAQPHFLIEATYPDGINGYSGYTMQVVNEQGEEARTLGQARQNFEEYKAESGDPAGTVHELSLAWFEGDKTMTEPIRKILAKVGIRG